MGHYNKYILPIKNISEWFLVCDLDEFVYARKMFKTIPEYLKSLHETVGNVLIPWKNYGSSGHIQHPKDGVVKNFTKRQHYLKETTNINVSGVTFDSNAQIAFDGTDDGINLGDNSLFDFTNGVATIEAVVKFPSSWTGGSQYPNLISKGGSAGWDTTGWSLWGFRDYPSSGQKSWGFAMRNGSTVRNTYIGNRDGDKYLHIVATIDGSTIRLYENGVQVATNTQTINPGSNTTNVYIGRGPSSQYFPGDIPIAKMYNKTLSAEEVKQNYNAYKKRFGL